MAVTLLDISDKTGLSTATISRVLNESPLVKEDTRNKVLAAIKELGYAPSLAARMLKGQSTKTLGVVLPHVSHFYADILMGIHETALQEDYHLMTGFAYGHEDVNSLSLQYIQEGRVDALIVVTHVQAEQYLNSLAGATLPIIALDQPLPAEGIVSVTMDNRQAASDVMNHLLSLGYKDIAIMTGANDFDSCERVAGCREVATKAGIPLSDKNIWHGNFREELARTVIRERISKKKVPRAIFALNDMMALGIYDELTNAGYRVPEDVALVGFDDINASRFTGLTSVRVPWMEMGREASRLALMQIHGETPPPQVILPASLIIRKTCGGSPEGNK